MNLSVSYFSLAVIGVSEHPIPFLLRKKTNKQTINNNKFPPRFAQTNHDRSVFFQIILRFLFLAIQKMNFGHQQKVKPLNETGTAEPVERVTPAELEIGCCPNVLRLDCLLEFLRFRRGIFSVG